MFLRTTSSTPPTLNQVPINIAHKVAHIRSLIKQVLGIYRKFTLGGTVRAMQQLIAVCLDENVVNRNKNHHLLYTLKNLDPGITLRAQTRANGGDTVVLTGTFGRGEYSYVEHILNNGELSNQPLVLDLGATIGDFGLYLKYIGLDPYIVSVEGDSEAAEVCKYNFMENNLDGAVIGKPISADGRQVKFDTSSMTTRRKIRETYGAEVSSVTLSEVMKEFYGEPIDLCKIDIEGGEFELLTHENNIHFNRMRHIILEYHTTFHDFDKHISKVQNYFGNNFDLQWEKPILKKYYAGGTIIGLVYMKNNGIVATTPLPNPGVDLGE